MSHDCIGSGCACSKPMAPTDEGKEVCKWCGALKNEKQPFADSDITEYNCEAGYYGEGNGWERSPKCYETQLAQQADLLGRMGEVLEV